MKNGEWEPDPREAECTPERELETTGTTMPMSTYKPQIINMSHGTLCEVQKGREETDLHIRNYVCWANSVTPIG